MDKKKIAKIYESAKKYFFQIKKKEENNLMFENVEVISDNIPGFTAKKMNINSYEERKYAVMFIKFFDEKNIKVSDIDMYYSRQITIFALLKVIEEYSGYVVDIMNNGIMVLYDNDTGNGRRAKNRVMIDAGNCGRSLMTICEEVVNKILGENDLKWRMKFGIGITHGRVIVTKLGIDNLFDVKIFGDVVNKASKYSNNKGKIKVSKNIKDSWPKGNKPTIKFKRDNDGYFLQTLNDTKIK